MPASEEGGRDYRFEGKNDGEISGRVRSTQENQQAQSWAASTGESKEFSEKGRKRNPRERGATE